MYTVYTGHRFIQCIQVIDKCIQCIISRKSCTVKTTLWSVSFCPAELKEDNLDINDGEMVDDDNDDEEEGEEEEEVSCRHITVHPDQLLTTAIIDGLTPCTQYIIRYSDILYISSQLTEER